MNYDEMLGVEPTASQKKAFDSFIAFTNDDSTPVFLLKGYAGTGKTTMLRGFLKYLAGLDKSCRVLASTGRAAKIASDAVGMPAGTIHSEIYFFNDLDKDLETLRDSDQRLDREDDGQLNLVFRLRSCTSDSTIFYLIDESSMISDEEANRTSFARYGSGKLLTDIFEYDANGKFIFIGDAAQLPPVNQAISPALSASYISIHFGKKAAEMELTEVMRQQRGSGIMQASIQLRRLYQQNMPVKWPKLPVKGFDNIHLLSDHARMIHTYSETIREHGYRKATMLCQTNRHCASLNRTIRKLVGFKSPDLQPGDLLMVTQNNYIVPLVNGDQVRVLKTGKTELRCGLSFLQVEVQEITRQQTFRVMLVEDVLHSRHTNLDNAQHRRLLIDFYKRMKAAGITQKSHEFKQMMMKDPYLNALRAVYGYALTCHKSQGGEWDRVYLYLDNKIVGLPKPGVYQWWYTAVTRARNQLFVVNDWFLR